VRLCEPHILLPRTVFHRGTLRLCVWRQTAVQVVAQRRCRNVTFECSSSLHLEMPFVMSPYWSGELPEEFGNPSGADSWADCASLLPRSGPKNDSQRPTGPWEPVLVRFWVTGSHDRPKNQPRKDFRSLRNLSRPIRSTQGIWC
jgi:hypothetical protein